MVIVLFKTDQFSPGMECRGPDSGYLGTLLSTSSQAVSRASDLQQDSQLSINPVGGPCGKTHHDGSSKGI